MAVSLTIDPASKKHKQATLDVPDLDKTTVYDLRKQLGKRYHLNPNRVRLTKDVHGKKEVLKDGERSLASYGVAPKDTLVFKDIGMQLDWRTVYIIEYFMPLVFHPLFYFIQKPIYGRSFEHTQVQKTAFVMFMLHFLKREVETMFLHVFSSDTMPIFNLFRNSAYYWFPAGLFPAITLYHPDAPALVEKYLFHLPPNLIPILTSLWVLVQLGNFHAHVVLARIRKDNPRERKIPRGGLFELVSVPNYFYEWCGWVIVTVLTRDPMVAVFLAIGTYWLPMWAVQRHRKYRKEFKDYPRNRKIMFPFVY